MQEAARGKQGAKEEVSSPLTGEPEPENAEEEGDQSTATITASVPKQAKRIRTEK